MDFKGKDKYIAHNIQNLFDAALVIIDGPDEDKKKYVAYVKEEKWILNALVKIFNLQKGGGRRRRRKSRRKSKKRRKKTKEKRRR